ncbi:Target SNARE coiled-coil domain [Trinorchestia longiramus]|nr:Target SNARE coiled-coil domain [Trinorchestia longiramus]
MVTLKPTCVASIDHTNLFKSCTKTLQARSRASGISYPASRIFPGQKSSTDGGAPVGSASKLSVSTASFFFRAREVHDHISKLKQLLLDRKKIYIGRINDPASLTPEQCAIMDQILTQKLKIVEQQIVDLESKIPSATFQFLKKSIWTSPRPGDNSSSTLTSSEPDSTSSSGSVKSKITKEEKKTIIDAECCMAITAVVVRSHLADLNALYSDMRQAKQRKEDVKAKLMRLHRPACVEKGSTIRMRQLQMKEQENVPETVAIDNRRKVELEDWRADDELCDITQRSSRKPSANTKKLKDLVNSSSNSSTSQDRSSGLSENNSLFINRNTDASSESKLKSRTHSPSSDDGAVGTTDQEREGRRYISQDAEYEGSVLSEEQSNMLEQENMMLYNELQSTHEEVRHITQQVAELGKLQDVLMESVQEQAVIADSVQHHVMVATDNVLEGNEQLGRLVSESACEQEDPGSNPAADMVDAARITAWDLGKQPNNYRSNYPTQEWARSIPSINSSIPSINSSIPSISSSIPSINSSIPSINSSIPSINSSIPSINSSIPSINYTLKENIIR